MRRVSWLGVAVGALTDWVATNVIGVAVVAYLAVALGEHVPPTLMQATILEMLRTDPAVRAFLLVTGSLCTVLGGWVAARIARRHEQLNGSLASIVGVGTAVSSLVTGRSSSHSMLVRIGLLLLAPALAWLGGYLRTLQLRRRARAAAERTGAVFS